jgi:hypothetical protein
MKKARPAAAEAAVESQERINQVERKEKFLLPR